MTDFSPRGYASMVQAFGARGFRLIGFDELAATQTGDDSLCLLRHDVDACLDYAVEMGEMEQGLGVRSTYFVMLRSPMYNLLGRHGLQALRTLQRQGHDIGLHFDAGASDWRDERIEDSLAFELGVLEHLLGRAVRAFSLHQPSEAVIGRRLELSGIINTYHPAHLEGFTYISDSNRAWRDQNPWQLAASAARRIHVLLHPIWWMCPHADVARCWDAAVLRNFEASQRQLLATERAYGPARVMHMRRSQGHAPD
jgi:hypothetical protein